MRAPTRTTLAVAAAVTALLLGGCSGDGADQDDAAGSGNAQSSGSTQGARVTDGSGADDGDRSDGERRGGSGKGDASGGDDASDGPEADGGSGAASTKPPEPVRLPSDFPRGVALVDGELLEATGDADGWVVVTRTGTELAETVRLAYYQLVDDGFVEEDRAETSRRSVVELASAERELSFEVVANDDGTSTVTYTVGPKVRRR